jgi:hypothetical protein
MTHIFSFVIMANAKKRNRKNSTKAVSAYKERKGSAKFHEDAEGQ